MLMLQNYRHYWHDAALLYYLQRRSTGSSTERARRDIGQINCGNERIEFKISHLYPERSHKSGAELISDQVTGNNFERAARRKSRSKAARGSNERPPPEKRVGDARLR
jgi:hypothetical protein